MHIPPFEVLTIAHVWQQGDYAFPIDFKYTCFHIPIVKYHYYFLCFVWQSKPYPWKVLPIRLTMTPRVFISLTKPGCFFASARVFILSIWMIHWSAFALSLQT